MTREEYEREVARLSSEVKKLQHQVAQERQEKHNLLTIHERDQKAIQREVSKLSASEAKNRVLEDQIADLKSRLRSEHDRWANIKRFVCSL